MSVSGDAAPIAFVSDALCGASHDETGVTQDALSVTRAWA